MIIDAHQHTNWLGHTTAGLIENMDARGISGSWLLTWECPMEERDPIYYRVSDPRRNNLPLEDVIAACQHYPDRFVAGYAPDPRLPGAMERLEAAVELFHVRVYGEWKYRTLLETPECIAMFRLCGRLKLPVIIHLDVPFLPPNDLSKVFQWWFGGTIENLERTLQFCPDTIFLGHGPGFWRYLSGDGDENPVVYPKDEFISGGKIAPLMRRYPNLYCDLSAGSARFALGRNQAYTLEFIDEFQDRLLFGRDQFDNLMHEFLVNLNLPARISEKIFYQNAMRLVPPEGTK
jgi:predicted TIM-barrel fold metal-dependent hydrolase